MQTTAPPPFSKTGKKTSKTPTKKQYMQKLLREKHVEVKYSHGSIFSLSTIDRLWVGLKTGRANFDTFLDITFLLLELFFKFKLICKVETNI